MESLGGKFEITSHAGQGTTVTLQLPQSAPPSGYALSVAVPPSAHVVVCDDDPSIHQAWDRKLTNIADRPVFHFHQASELLRWVRSREATDALFLIDHEYRGSAVNGLDLIAELGIKRHSILVTNRSEDQGEVFQRCQAMGIRLLPKSLLTWVPLQSH